MLNQIVLVGRLVQEPILIETEAGEKAKINIKIPRSFKNSAGVDEFDNFECVLCGKLHDNIIKILKSESVVGIRGRLQNFKEPNIIKNIVIADSFSFKFKGR